MHIYNILFYFSKNKKTILVLNFFLKNKPKFLTILFMYIIFISFYINFILKNKLAVKRFWLKTT